MMMIGYNHSFKSHSKTFVMNKPLFYVRQWRIMGNMYGADAHPNDKSSKAVKGQSRGRMKGLEEAGWTPCATYGDAVLLSLGLINQTQ
jgi:hypothetical protein